MTTQGKLLLCLALGLGAASCAGGLAGDLGARDAGIPADIGGGGESHGEGAPQSVDAGAESRADAGDSARDAGTEGKDGGVAVVTDVPDSLVRALSGASYVEGSCVPATYAGWPYAAQDCTYHGGSHVIIANPSPTRVATWIVEASRLIPALDGLRTRDRASWEAALKIIAEQTLYQSSRIYPLRGEIWEGGVDYGFTKGVTDGCTTGCYCRINSLTRAQWCTYQAALGRGSKDACLDEYGVKTLKAAWLDHCFANHVAAWTSDANEHYRAQAYLANLAIAAQFPHPATADGAAVVKAVQAQYPP